MKLDAGKTAFVLPGQGSQMVGMGRELAARYPAAKQIFDEADSILGFGLSRLMWEGPEAELNDTLNTQPALYVHSLAAYRAFASQYPDFKPAILAGHSLGEISALAAAGALPFDAGLRLVRRRGELMKQAGEKNPGSMAAVLGVDIATLEKVCREATRGDEVVQVANDNCPGQVVISGAKAAVERAMEGAKAAGARRAISLAVSIAAHSPLMASAQEGFNRAVDEAPMDESFLPVIGNVLAAPLDSAGAARADLKAQLTSRVRWTESVQAMAGRGVTVFVEAGTGSVLLGLIRRIEPSAAGFPLGTPQDLDALD
jgi:[acyl-carrier-protein] S-malonyltransferase